MWRLWHYLFGSDYVIINWFTGDRWELRRVRRRPDGKPYVYAYAYKIGMVYLLPEGQCRGQSYITSWHPVTEPPPA